ncbi:hypothetical protein [Paraburkholderia sp. BL10I2N1]|uniref:hypothetical protein n=1 Tax=Paraburkholderia sp. BL10I2N1 TaxID=1938796 RepID=UPI0010615F06|nr:hypothetical protein [Paraburkholderia sp. BL10I2N1]TDN59070.1 hypothetical protein B0G77_8259 [Paraburkholderia sp. BL10I2N1]
MKLVIDELTNPLLYARLSAESSPRERAALFRLIAESALRGEAVGVSSTVSSGPASRAIESGAGALPESRAEQVAAPAKATAEPEFRTESNDDRHDLNLVADEFEAFD